MSYPCERIAIIIIWQISVLCHIHILFPFQLIITRGGGGLGLCKEPLEDEIEGGFSKWILGVCSIRVSAKKHG